MCRVDYALYKGDSFLFVGSVKECAEYLGVQEKNIYRIASKGYKNSIKKPNNVVMAFKLES